MHRFEMTEEKRYTIVLVLRSGGDFSFRDVQLISSWINARWKSPIRPRIICLWDQATGAYDLGNLEIIPLRSTLPGTWSRMELYNPEMEQYRPFLYIDLDTAVIQSLEEIIKLVVNPKQLIVLEDFWQKGQMATGLVWVPAGSDKVSKIWEGFRGVTGFRMDSYLRSVVKPDAFWQQLTNTIYDFKPRNRVLLDSVPKEAVLICFHGHPRIFNAQHIGWVKEYVVGVFSKPLPIDKRVTVIIPYKKDRGWLNEAIASVPQGVQLLLSQGEGNWPENFNKALPEATGDYIRWLHEDDKLTENSIPLAVQCLEETGADFIHGNAIMFRQGVGRTKFYRPTIQVPTFQNLLVRNVIHSATLMYRREVFDQVGLMDESLNTAEEYEFNLRCLKAGLKIGYCNNTLAYYRIHPLQKVRVVPKVEKVKEKEMVKLKYVSYV